VPVAANNVPVHHWPLGEVRLSRWFGGTGSRRVVHETSPYIRHGGAKRASIDGESLYCIAHSDPRRERLVRECPVKSA
jgi:hypothetical protein